MPWEKSYKETDVLERAMLAFWARGYEATSINDLVEATGINRGSIYAAFDDKHGLFTQALQHYDRVHRQDYLNRLAENHGPKDAILTAFKDAAPQYRSRRQTRRMPAGQHGLGALASRSGDPALCRRQP